MTNLIYTSYFAKADCFDPREYCLIGIAGKSPDGWSGHEYKALAPSWSIWREWHDAMAEAASAGSVEARLEAEDVARNRYTERFVAERLGKLDPKAVLDDIRAISGVWTPVLMCYETPGKFCHRHRVASWLLEYSNRMLESDNVHDNDLIVREYDWGSNTTADIDIF